jgi:hypothetical protein
MHFGIDDLIEGRLAILAFFLEAVLDHRDHGTILIEGHHRQGAVGIADALEPAQFAGS